MKHSRHKHRKRQRKLRLNVSAAIILLFIIALFAGHIIYNNPQLLSPKFLFCESAPEGTTLTVTFLDVGQGNCVLAESDGHYMLIDGGDNTHSSFVVSYLKKHGIKQLDYVLVSHYDADHLSGIIGVLYNYPTDTLLTPDYVGDTKTYQSYLKCIDSQKITPVHPETGTSYALGNAEFTIICPDNYDYEEENNLSLGIRLTDGSSSFLILGDAQSQSESAILQNHIEISSDVYMVSHHGSSSSSSEKFLEAVNPQYAVISVGADNDYGHPTQKVLSRLEALHIQILRTDQNGTITAYSTNDGIFWNLEKN